jgi:hypothetical protein
MNILIYTQVKKVKKWEFDFSHDEENYKFRNRKIADLNKDCDYRVHIDRIDNDYSGDPPPLYACVYFGNFDAHDFDFSDDCIKYDLDVFFAKKSYKGKDIEYGTFIVGDSVDMFELKECYEWLDLVNLWLYLYEQLGSKIMLNAGIETTGNNIYLTKKEANEYKKELDKQWEDYQPLFEV